MKRLAFLFLAACSGATFTSIGPDDASPADVDGAIEDGGARESEAPETSTDAGDSAALDVASEDAITCGTDGGACSPGSCCAGLHCFAGKCTACKPDGVIAISSGECCNPQAFANSVCGGVKTCAAPNYDKCGPSNNGLACCGGAQCKQNGQIWACGCGPVDAPCHVGNDFECCSNSCDSKGWCT